MSLDSPDEGVTPQVFFLQYQPQQNNRLNARRAALLLALTIFLSIAAGMYLPLGIDWAWTFRPAALALMAGRSPYSDLALAAPFAGPPWALLPVLPLALLPEWLGRGFFFGLSLLGFAASAVRLGARPVALVAFLTSPPVFHCLLNANLDWMPLLGFTLPPTWGLFLVLVKPQMGIVMALFWLMESWRMGGIRAAVRRFAPVTVCYLLSFALFGFWPRQMLAATSFTAYWNASLWPGSIPIGLTLATLALSLRNAHFAMAASPFLSPHVLFHSWAGIVLALVRNTRAAFVACVLLWLLITLYT